MVQDIPNATPTATLLRRVVLIVAALNLAYFAIEFSVAQAIGSVALFADSIDFLEDALVNLLVVLALGWAATKRKLVGLGLALLLLIPSFAALWTAYLKLQNPLVVDVIPLTVTAFGALLVNGTCALMLARVRNTGGSLSKAAFLSARNDVYANIAIMVAGVATAFTASIWPDLIVGLAIAAVNAGAAHEVYEAALNESDEPRA